MYKTRVNGWLKYLDFLLLDCLCLGIAFFAAFWIRHGIVNPFLTEGYDKILAVMMVLNAVLIIFLETMKNVIKRGWWDEVSATLWQACLLLLCVSTYLFCMKIGDGYSRMVIILTTAIYAVVTFLVRMVWKHIMRNTMRHRTNNALLIIGAETSAGNLIDEIKSNNYGQYKIVGVSLPDRRTVGTRINGAPVVACYEGVVDYVRRNWVDEVLLSVPAGQNLPGDMINSLAVMGVVIHIHLDQSPSGVGVKQIVESIGDLQVLTTTMNYMTTEQAIAKRAIDILGGLVGCLLTGIIYLFIAPKIKKESPGPVFFTQTRVGKNGKPFKIYKFRSMYLDAEKRKAELMAQNRIKDGLMFKMDFDPRIIGNRIDENGNQVTGIGEFIRKYSLDEFPQFFNVLKGDMSLNGTRPPLPDEYEAYSAHHKARLAVKPGITGLWQVSGRSNILDFEEVVQLDTQYINNWSIALDFKILLKTVLVVLKHEGSM